MNINQPFQPLEILKRKPAPKQLQGVAVQINKGERMEKELVEKEEEPVEKVEEKKSIIKDKRKYSTIERSIIFDRLKDRDIFRVVSTHTPSQSKTKEVVEYPIVSIGQPEIIKIYKKIELKDLDEEAEEAEEAEDEEPEELMKTFEKEGEEPEGKKPEGEEVEKPKKSEKPIVEKPEQGEKPKEINVEKTENPKAKRTKKVKTQPEDELINVDLSTVKINGETVQEMLPKPTEKVIVKAPTYYMNNRKLFVQKLNELFQPYKKEIMANDTSISCDKRNTSDEFQLLTHQKIVRDYLNLYSPYRGLLLYHGLGSGKCHKKDTPIIMADGSIKMVQDILEGDFLMGDDSTPRTVMSLATGRDKMYDIIPIKGEKYTVNQEHILCLKLSGYPKLSYSNNTKNTSYNIQWIENNTFCSKTFTFSHTKQNELEQKIAAENFMETINKNPMTNSNIIEIAVKDYLQLSDTKKAYLKGYKVPIEFPERELPIDPYMIGYWLGDGTCRGAEITCQDSTVLYYFAKQLPNYNLSLNYWCGYTYGITGDGKHNNNAFLNTLKQLNMANNKHIPHIYKCNSRENRLKLLAGLIDSYGHYNEKGNEFEFTQKNESVMDDVIYLVRSLGFSCYKAIKNTSWTYEGVKKFGTAWRININGEGIEEIPTKIPRKQANPRKQIKDALVTGITVEYVGEDDYYGFTLDKNCRYVMGDFTVTHNTCTSIALAEGMKTDKQIYILTPASLKMNFFSELKNCGDHIYKKNQYWEFVSIDGKPEYVSILAKALSLPKEYIRTHGGAWLVNIQMEANYTDKSQDEQKEIDEQLNEMIRSKYIDINYNGLNMNGLKKITADFTKNPFDNSVVLIDEAHNFVSRIVNKLKKKKSISYLLYEYLMNASNARVVFMSGTPIINYPNEIAITYNILRGYIKSWTFTLTVKTAEKINNDTILQMFEKEGVKTYDYVEYSGNKLTITRNPFGFINVKKRGTTNVTKVAKTEAVIKRGGSKKTAKDSKSSQRKTKKSRKSGYDEIVDKIVYPEQNVEEDASAEKAYRVGYNFESNPQKGAGELFDKYNGVKRDAAGNITDADFEKMVSAILKKNGLEIQKTEIKKYKALPDDTENFLKTFVDAETGEVKNMPLFQKRILGLTSYFRSAQESLLPNFVKTEDGNIFHIVKADMTPHQYAAYEKIRKVEAEQEKRNKKAKQKVQEADEELFKISSTYRIFSRAACNFAFPPSIQRPMPERKSAKGEEGEEIDENDINAISLEERKREDVDVEEVTEESKAAEESGESENVKYLKRIEAALEQLAYNPENIRDVEYLRKDALGTYSPKFVKLLENVQSEDNQGLHLIYSQFRTIEGIGILKLILEANGFAEFKIRKNADMWEIVENPKDAGKPKFVLYTGTEGAEEKEIVRNIYNSSWDFVPSNIATRLREQGENNFMGEIIKIFMITSSGAEGINLKNTRFVHIVEPYWHMVRIEQVIGRARRICSHQDLPEEFRTVKVFLYIATLSEEQKVNENNIELRIRDVSRFDHETPVTTDETLFEAATVKDKINRQILKSMKESAMDCNLYASKNKDEQLVCYNFGKITSNQFGSFPSFETDMSEKQDLNVRGVVVKAVKITYKNVDYAYNKDNNEVYDYASYTQAKETGAEPTVVGKIVGNKIVFV
jgi:hypothetical protein